MLVMLVQCADFTIRHYGLATMVFDGYGAPSIKDNTHQRRSMNVHRVVHFSVYWKEGAVLVPSFQQEKIHFCSTEE